MNLLNCIWQPEILISTSYAQITTPPCGKPDPFLERIPGLLRRRVFQKRQIGPTCMYYAARRISPHFGKKDFSLERINEMMVSLFRKHLSSIMLLDRLPLVEGQKVFFLTYFIIFFSKAFYPSYQKLYIDWFLIQALLKPQRLLENQLITMTTFCFKTMLYKMHIQPFEWAPSEGPWGLLKALKVHLYCFCMGDFGAHVFEYQRIANYHPKLGPIYTGPLKRTDRPLSKIFSMHAILVIGLVLKNYYQGSIYFIDPNDPSGPGLLQKIYQIDMQDFFSRMRNAEGLQEQDKGEKNFIWVGDPKLFLA